jgi:phosphohistidine phosphatase SixA
MNKLNLDKKVGSVFYSPICRAKETAGSIITKGIQQEQEALDPTITESDKKWLNDQINTPPASGKFNFLITHKQVLTGYYKVGGASQGISALFIPGDKKEISPKLLGCLKPEDWKTLADK